MPCMPRTNFVLMMMQISGCRKLTYVEMERELGETFEAAIKTRWRRREGTLKVVT